MAEIIVVEWSKDGSLCIQVMCVHIFVKYFSPAIFPQVTIVAKMPVKRSPCPPHLLGDPSPPIFSTIEPFIHPSQHETNLPLDFDDTKSTGPFLIMCTCGPRKLQISISLVSSSSPPAPAHLFATSRYFFCSFLVASKKNYQDSVQFFQLHYVWRQYGQL